MARIFITGSSDGLGLMTAKRLISQGHQVILHARSQSRAKETLAAAPGAADCLIADFSSLAQVKQLAVAANKSGRFDAILHNAGIGYQEPFKLTEDGFSHVFAINVLAPYILTCLMEKPERLVYMSSALHSGGRVDQGMKDLTWVERGKAKWSGFQAYSDSKQLDAILAFAFARRWPHVASNAVDPGWVATKMGGPGASQDINKSIDCMVKAVSADTGTIGTGKMLVAQGTRELHPSVEKIEFQDALLRECARISGVELPA